MILTTPVGGEIYKNSLYSSAEYAKISAKLAKHSAKARTNGEL